MRNQRNLAEAARAVVSVDELLQHLLAAGGAGFNDAAALKADLNAFNHCSLVRERLCRGDGALGAVLVRRGENFFSGHVGYAVVAIVGSGATAEPEMVVGEAEAKVGAGAAIVESGEALFVKECRALVQLGVVRLPCAHGVSG